ncbi:flagellar export chaperone FliS [Piscirickettsia salmonis]|uniref:Flagellar secretion chaperone FliS n=1 Tax=Piscirickettsia salmonis TaxID=1238 RepID=A0A9Q5YJW9_PISSA|nr:flagellar export chaperone FliS [Piscirickettsia salmonis]PRP61627.1 flagellar export chaperone FliS [Bacillus halotolerans]ALA24606.1 flagellar protein FliS [Piscirickettsia salmonis]APS44955.1 flagellar export chaperone FliS [Piscirickettsia salmonis]APS48316.1 flagellar export chaperone FliS [Piscirickettsia salmonis]APS49578.1 flagellar export chaperone FliS [Piscirickettsia salmonis]
MNRGIQEYKSTVARSEVDANPYRIVQLLMEGVLSRVLATKSAIENNEVEKKCDLIQATLKIVNALRMSLDMEQGAGLSKSLDSLYQHMSIQLTRANMNNDLECLDNVFKSMSEIKSGWDAIEDDALKFLKEQHSANSLESKEGNL